MPEKLSFQTDPNRKKKKTNPVINTPTASAKETFDLEKFAKSQKEADKKAAEPAQTSKPSEKKVMGRPPKNKKYTTARLQKNTVNQLNAIQNTLGYDTQDDLVVAMLDRIKKELNSDERTVFEMYMKTYQARDEKKGK